MTPFHGLATTVLDAPIAEVDGTSAPETDLDLSLFGIIASGRDAGRAVISAGDGPQMRYSIGDEIEGANGATVNRIYADSVLLDRDGTIERLNYTGDNTLGALQVFDADAPVARNAPSTTERATATEPPAQGTAQPTSDQTRASAQLSRGDFLTLAQSIRFDTNTGDQSEGVSIFPTRNADVFRRAGLVPGDVVTSAGGVTVTSENDFSRLMTQVEADKTLDLTLIRNGQSRVLTIKLQE